MDPYAGVFLDSPSLLKGQRAFEPSRSPQTVQSFDFQSLHQLETILTVKTVDYIFSSHLCVCVCEKEKYPLPAAELFIFIQPCAG